MLTDDELATVIGCRRPLVSNMRRAGAIPAVRLGPRTWRYRSDQIVQWLNSCLVVAEHGLHSEFSELPDAGELVDAKFVAERLNVPINTVYFWIHSRRVSFYRVSPRRPRFLIRRLCDELTRHLEPFGGDAASADLPREGATAAEGRPCS